MSVLAALAFLGSLALFGILLLRQVFAWLTSLELIVYGPVIGMVVGSLLVLGLAHPIGLLPATIVVGAFCLVGALLYWPWSGGTGAVRTAVLRVGREVGIGAGLLIGIIGLRFAVLWAGALTVDAQGLWAGHEYIWSDWTLHLGDTAAFAYTDNFPPSHPRLADAPLAYHYLTSVTAASMVVLGMDPIVALPLQSFLLSMALVGVLFAFVRRVSGDRAVAALGLALFLFGGSLGWVLLFGGPGSPLELLVSDPWSQPQQLEAGFRWLNPYLALVMSQRAALYGIPIVLLVLTVVLVNARRDHAAWREWLAAGLVAGVLPLAHIGGLAALGLMVPALLLVFPRRGWIAFLAVFAVVGSLILFGVQGGEARAGSSLRWAPGWMTGEDPWIWFWVKNLGLFLPLGVVGWLVRDLLPGPSRRLLLAFLGIFVVANLFILGAYDWDNSKVLLYFFLALAIASAAALVALWRSGRDPVTRGLVVVAVATMVGSGVLANLSQLMGHDRMLLAGPEDLALAEWAGEETAPDSVFAVGLEHNDPIPMLTGRQVITSYAPWLISLGLDPSRQEADLRSIMRLDPSAPELIEAYGVEYVAIGQWEIDELEADVEAFGARYSLAYESDEYRVFAVSP